MKMPYRLTCLRPLPAGGWRGLSEHHATLDVAVDAMLDHQQRRWTQITLTPLVGDQAIMPVATVEQQRALPLNENRGGGRR